MKKISENNLNDLDIQFKNLINLINGKIITFVENTEITDNGEDLFARLISFLAYLSAGHLISISNILKIPMEQLIDKFNKSLLIAIKFQSEGNQKDNPHLH